MYRVVAQYRDKSHGCFNICMDERTKYLNCATSKDMRDFSIDVIRSSIAFARRLRLSGRDYPLLP